MRTARSKLGPTLLTLAILLTALSCPNPVPIAPPGQGEAAAILDMLQQQGPIVPIQAPTVLSMVFELAEGPADTGLMSLRIQQGAALPRRGLFAIAKEALQYPGLYLGVVNDAGLFVHLTRLSDTRKVRAEGMVNGVLQPEFVTMEGAVLSARVPFARDGELKIFEIEHVGGGQAANAVVSRVLVVAPLGPAPFPDEGMLLEVPYS
jgi:hypothetical protein